MNETRSARSQATQAAMMDAAEKLAAEKGIEQISIRAIVSQAGQKNESALQYHFGNLKGLIGAIHQRRAAEVQARRAELLEKVEPGSEPALRDLVKLMVQPAFDLAVSDAGFRRYIKAFGHELAMAETSALMVVSSPNRGGGGESGQRLRELLQSAFTEFDPVTLQRRLDLAVRLSATAMHHQARQKNAFRGDEAILFFHNLLDALTGLLGAPVSAETAALKGLDR